MKILGKSISEDFQRFYDHTAERLGIAIEFRRNPPFKIWGACEVKNNIATIWLKTDMPEPMFEHNTAHELLHAVQQTEGWPEADCGENLPKESAEAFIACLISSTVLDMIVDEQLQKLGFDRSHADEIRYKQKRLALQTESVPELEKPHGCEWALHYVMASQALSPKRCGKLRALYQARAPHIAEKGEELVAILQKNGWKSPDQALASMVAIRDSLGLNSKQVTITNGKTGEKL